MKLSLEDFTDLVIDRYSRGYDTKEYNLNEKQEEIVALAIRDFELTEKYKSELISLNEDEIPEEVLKVVKPDERWFDENNENWKGLGFDPEETLKKVVISYIEVSENAYLWDILTESEKDLVRDLSEEVEKEFYDYERNRDFYYEVSYKAIESWYESFLEVSD